LVSIARPAAVTVQRLGVPACSAAASGEQHRKSEAQATSNPGLRSHGWDGLFPTHWMDDDLTIDAIMDILFQYYVHFITFGRIGFAHVGRSVTLKGEP
jgi:hypothetical protein